MAASIYHAMQAGAFARASHASNEISIKDYIVGAADALNCVRAYITCVRAHAPLRVSEYMHTLDACIYARTRAAYGSSRARIAR